MRRIAAPAFMVIREPPHDLIPINGRKDLMDALREGHTASSTELEAIHIDPRALYALTRRGRREVSASSFVVLTPSLAAYLGAETQRRFRRPQPDLTPVAPKPGKRLMDAYGCGTLDPRSMTPELVRLMTSAINGRSFVYFERISPEHLQGDLVFSPDPRTAQALSIPWSSEGIYLYGDPHATRVGVIGYLFNASTGIDRELIVANYRFDEGRLRELGTGFDAKSYSYSGQVEVHNGMLRRGQVSERARAWLDALAYRAETSYRVPYTPPQPQQYADPAQRYQWDPGTNQFLGPF